jgi:hypothetical protein
MRMYGRKREAMRCFTSGFCRYSLRWGMPGKAFPPKAISYLVSNVCVVLVEERAKGDDGAVADGLIRVQLDQLRSPSGRRTVAKAAEGFAKRLRKEDTVPRARE